GTANLAPTQPVERLVRPLERERFGLGPDGDERREREELLAVAAGEVRDGADRALLPEELVRERRDVAHVDAGADHGAALGEHPERRRHELAGGREDDRRVELLRRGLAGGPRPFAAQRERECPRRLVAGPDEAEQAAALVAGDLRDDVGCGAEAVEPEPLG